MLLENIKNSFTPILIDKGEPRERGNEGWNWKIRVDLEIPLGKKKCYRLKLK